MLYYPIQTEMVLLGTKDGTNRTVNQGALTTSYQAESGVNPTKSFATGGMSRVELSILYTMGATETSNSIELRLEQSPDGTNWYPLPNDSTSGGISTITEREFTYVGTTDAGNSEITIGVDIAYKNMRIAFKETGVVTNAGSVYCEALLSGL